MLKPSSINCLKDIITPNEKQRYFYQRAKVILGFHSRDFLKTDLNVLLIGGKYPRLICKIN